MEAGLRIRCARPICRCCVQSRYVSAQSGRSPLAPTVRIRCILCKDRFPEVIESCCRGPTVMLSRGNDGLLSSSPIARSWDKSPDRFTLTPRPTFSLQPLLFVSGGSTSRNLMVRRANTGQGFVKEYTRLVFDGRSFIRRVVKSSR